MPLSLEAFTLPVSDGVGVDAGDELVDGLRRGVGLGERAGWCRSWPQPRAPTTAPVVTTTLAVLLLTAVRREGERSAR